jgi:hypothetical protein
MGNYSAAYAEVHGVRAIPCQYNHRGSCQSLVVKEHGANIQKRNHVVDVRVMRRHAQSVLFAGKPRAAAADMNCKTGAPASLVIAGSMPINIQTGSLRTLDVQAFDSAGNPLSNVPVTFTAPASGPGGTFNLLVYDTYYHYVPTPDPLNTTVNTQSSCYGTPLYFIANDVTGAYQVTATSGSAPPLVIPILNVPAPAVTSLDAAALALNSAGASKYSIAHIGRAFNLFQVQAYAGQNAAGAASRLRLPCRRALARVDRFQVEPRVQPSSPI